MLAGWIYPQATAIGSPLFGATAQTVDLGAGQYLVHSVQLIVEGWYGPVTERQRARIVRMQPCPALLQTSLRKAPQAQLAAAQRQLAIKRITIGASTPSRRPQQSHKNRGVHHWHSTLPSFPHKMYLSPFLPIPHFFPLPFLPEV